MTASDVRPDVSQEALARIPLLVDLDAHLVEPPNIWVDRLPARYREVGPHVVYLPGGNPKMIDRGYIEAPGTEGPPIAWWFYEDHKYSVKRLIAAAGFPPEEITLRGVTFDEMRPGCWNPKERLADMDANGVEAQLCFPNYPRFCGQIFLWGKDRELALLCVKAYNDWMVEEWCAGQWRPAHPALPGSPVGCEAGGRGGAPQRGPGCAAPCAFSELPAYLELPSIYSGQWDPFFAACDETGTVVCCHIGSGTKQPVTSPDAPEAVAGTIVFGNSVGAMADYLYSGIFRAIPESEGDAGGVSDRLDPVSARADRRRLGDASRMEPQPAVHHGAPFDDVLGPHVLDLLQGFGRH